MMDISEHYGQLLGLYSPWSISDVNLNMANHRVDISIEYADNEGPCPECGAMSPKHNERESRVWRQLDTMQFATYLNCRVPRVRCAENGAKTLATPRAGKSSRFTLMFEAFAIKFLIAVRSVEEARKVLGLNWHQVDKIKVRAVERGIARRQEESNRYIGIDEKQFRSGHRYISNLVDLDQGRVLDVVHERTEKAAKSLLEKDLATSQRSQVEAVAVDMWPAFAYAFHATLPSAVIVHDRVHISQHLNQAVDLVSRQENRQLSQQGDLRPRGTKYMWLANQKNQHERIADTVVALRDSNLKVDIAWAIKEKFRPLLDYRRKACAKRYFDGYHSLTASSCKGES